MRQIKETKFFPLAVRCFDPATGINDYLLHFYEEPKESSEAISQCITDTLRKFSLDIKHVVVYTADNASVNYGKVCSVFQNLRLLQRNMIKANCHCHIVHNATRHSLKLVSYDVESFILKVYNAFSQSSKNVADPKECFEFVQEEYRQILRHIPIRWLTLFQAVDRLLLSWRSIKVYFLKEGEDSCDKIVWKFIGDQEHGLSTEAEPTLAECYLYFFHHVLFQFHKTILILEKTDVYACDVYAIVNGLRKRLESRLKEQYFGEKATKGSKYLRESEAQKSRTEALKVYERAVEYLSKWFDYGNSPFKQLSCLSLTITPPTLEEVVSTAQLMALQLNEDTLFDEMCMLKEAFPALKDEKMSSAETWCKDF